MRLHPEVWAPLAGVLGAGPEVAHSLASHVFGGLKAQGILIKNVSTMHPLLEGCLRVTVGTPQENDAFIAALAGLLKPPQAH